MKVLVTGATGFIGNYVIRELLKKKDFKVIATSRNKNKAAKFDWFSKIEYFEFDLNDNNENLFSFFGNPDILIHLAWDGLPNYKSLNHIEVNLLPNYYFIKNLVRNGLKKVNIVGTCFEYGMQNGCLSEELDPKPSNPYAVAKDSLRKFVEELNKYYQFDFNWIRLFYMYGKGQNENSLLAQLDRAIDKGEETFKMSGGEQIRDYLPVELIAENIVKISFQTSVKGIINCCSGKPISVKDFVENYLKGRGSTIKLELGFYPYPDYEPMSFWGDKSKLIRTLKDNENCNLCKSHNIKLIYSFKDVPIFQNKFFQNRPDAINSNVGSLRLKFCHDCGFIFNSAFDNKNMDYDSDYQNEQNYSPFFQGYLDQILALLKEKEFQNKRVVEIGTGKGYFYNLLKKNNFVDVIGFDPAYEGEEKGIIKDYFSREYSTNADLIILRHTLEHISNPFEFIKMLAESNNFKGHVFIEVPNFDWIQKKKAFWDIFYEHCNYFTKTSLQKMFKTSEVGLLFEGQYLYIYADLKNFLKDGIKKDDSYDIEFLFNDELLRIKTVLERNKNIAIWGAGAKGVTFLNTLDPERKIVKYAIDINSKKQNKFMARTGHEVLPPEKIGADIETIIIMNENYKKEVINSLKRDDIKFITLGDLHE